MFELNQGNTSVNKLKTRQQIANEYGIYRDTLRKVLKKNKLKPPKGLIDPKHQKEIILSVASLWLNPG